MHEVGAAQVIDRPAPVGSPAAYWYFATYARHEVPARHVLELANGRLLGRHVAVVSEGGCLDHETSRYFGLHSWREHPLHWNPFPGAPQEVRGTTAVLAARGTGTNYYHFVIDALPRLGMLERAFPGLRPDLWVLDRSTRYQQELLALLGLGEVASVSPGSGFHLRAERLLVPSLPNANTFVSPETTQWLRSRLPAETTKGLPERIYVTRGSTPYTRRVVHEEEIFGRLRRQGFARVDPGALSVREQIDLFAAARVVVSPHGAALTNLSFARDGVRVLELFAPGYVNGGYWTITGNIPDSRYRYLIAAGRPMLPGKDSRDILYDIEVTPDQVDAALESLLAD